MEIKSNIKSNLKAGRRGFFRLFLYYFEHIFCLNVTKIYKAILHIKPKIILEKGKPVLYNPDM